MESELSAALSQCLDTAPEPDVIQYSLHNLHPSTKTYLLQLYNIIYRTNCFHNVWSQAIVLMFEKSNKDPSIVTNLRPRSLTSCLSKLLEKMITSRQSWVLESSESFSASPSGFLKFRSTADSLILFHERIREAFESGGFFTAVLVDIQKSYDSTWKFGILRKLYQMGLQGHLPLFVQNFLSDRTFRVKIGKHNVINILTTRSFPGKCSQCHSICYWYQ